jgi:predicted ATPase
MYLKSIALENVGPIPSINLTLPFDGERPLPTVLVGTNGSGKTTLLSFIVNALVAFKQQVFEEAEVEVNRVFRIRSGLFLRSGAHFYRANLQFQDALSLEEWVLDRPRKLFESEVEPKPADEGWKKVAENESNSFEVSPATQLPPLGRRPEPKLAKLFSENVVLYFPSDRFEPPDWLNSKSLSAELQLPEPVTLEGFTARRILARSLLKPTLDWLQGLRFDRFLTETQPVAVMHAEPGSLPRQMQALLIEEGNTSALFNAAKLVLGRILGVEESAFQIEVEGRHSRRFVAGAIRDGKIAFRIPNLLGLSAGQSALFCLFCNIIRDFDLAGVQFSRLDEIRGIVLIDEADLHLHLDLQYRVLPELMKMFPKVQFIVTAHSPLFVMGMRNTFTEDGFRLVDMPSGNQISTEAYSEFVQAFEAFGATKSFEERLRTEVGTTNKPLLFVEGKNDRTHLETAWRKLYPDRERPFDILSCGDYGTSKKNDGGGVQTLKLMLELLGRYEVRKVVGLFDNDRAGAEQFNGLGQSHGFLAGEDALHRRHARGFVHAHLLPVPPERSDFVPEKIPRRVLELEHYYSDEVLNRFGVADDIIYPGSRVFPIKDTAKSAFAGEVQALQATEFMSFAPLFTRLLGILEIAAAQDEP